MACLVQMRTSRSPQFCKLMGCLKGWSGLMQKINSCNMCIKPNSKPISFLYKHKFPSFDQGDFGEDFTGQKYIWKWLEMIRGFAMSKVFSRSSSSRMEKLPGRALWDLATVPGWFPARQNREQRWETQQRPDVLNRNMLRLLKQLCYKCIIWLQYITTTYPLSLLFTAAWWKPEHIRTYSGMFDLG